MPSPFPGMDPYLEGYLWPDAHHRLATEISRSLTPLLRPRYVARIEVYTVEDDSPETEVGILYPDVEVLTARARESARPAKPGTALAEPRTLRAPLTIPIIEPIEARIASVEIRDAARNELVTAIEILSPVNKKEPGVGRYREKRSRLYRSGVHILEIDLLRRGVRPLANHPSLPLADYMCSLTRSRAPAIEVWPVRLREPLPTLPVPLRAPDPDVSLDLQERLRTVYDEAAYELSIDYARDPPPPPLGEEERRWIDAEIRRGES